MDGFVKIDFSVETEYGRFGDALYFPEGEVPDEATIEAMKQERASAYVNHVREASNRPPPSKYQRDENGNLILDINGDPIPTGV